MKFIGAMTGTMSGSLGGVTASHNRGGQYLRQRVVPTNPNTAGQMAVRSYMAAAVTTWQTGMSPLQRTGWGNYAANVPTTDSLGQELVLTGQQMFIRAAIARARAGQTFVLDPPTTFDRGIPASAVVAPVSGESGKIGIATGALSMEINIMDALSDAGDVVIQLGRPIAETVNFYKSPYCLWFAEAFTAVDFPIVIASAPSLSSAPFGTLTIGEIRPIRVTLVYDDGRVATAFEQICEVIDDV